MVINTNPSAQTGSRLLAESNNLIKRSLARLSSGSKLVSPSDDATGLASSMRFDAQLSRIGAAQSDVGNAVSFNQTQDGILEKVQGALGRMGELAVLARDETTTDSDRALYNTEFTRLGVYVDDLATRSFNGVSLFDGGAMSVTVDGDANTFSATGVNLGTATYTAASGSTVDSVSNASAALGNVKTAIHQLAADRSNIGSNRSVLNSFEEQLSVLRDNLTAANSRIKDANVAEETTDFARYNILEQAGTAMLAQANATPQSALRLLG